MTTTSRRLSQRNAHGRNNSTPGKTKGGNCVRPKDHGLAMSGNPSKLRGENLAKYNRLWANYKNAKGNK